MRLICLSASTLGSGRVSLLSPRPGCGWAAVARNTPVRNSGMFQAVQLRGRCPYGQHGVRATSGDTLAPKLVTACPPRTSTITCLDVVTALSDTNVSADRPSRKLSRNFTWYLMLWELLCASDGPKRDKRKRGTCVPSIATSRRPF